MIKKSLKSIVFLMMIFMIFTLTACGEDTGGNEDVNGEASSEVIEGYGITVNGSFIPQEFIDDNMKLITLMYESRLYPGVMQDEVEPGIILYDYLKESLIDKLIEEEIIMAKLKAEGYVIEEDELEAAFERSYSNGGALEFLKEQDLSEEFLKEQLEREMYYYEYKNNYLQAQEISDEDIYSRYEEDLEDRYTSLQFKASHILVDDKALGEEILEKIADGEDFEALAKEYSKCPSGENGGSLGYFFPDEMVAPFSEAVRELSIGEYTDSLVKTDFGYHIIYKEDELVEERPFEEVSNQVKRHYEDDLFQEYKDSLVSDADIDINLEKEEE